MLIFSVIEPEGLKLSAVVEISGKIEVGLAIYFQSFKRDKEISDLSNLAGTPVHAVSVDVDHFAVGANHDFVRGARDDDCGSADRIRRQDQ